uniref:Uncharacterized protein n=1 Tax=Arundo donax TaxID=35708 RepID=A0A0A9GH68_ARUDO
MLFQPFCASVPLVSCFECETTSNINQLLFGIMLLKSM